MPSSNGDSPHSGAGTMTATVGANANAVRQYPLPTRDFSIEIPSPLPQLATSTNGVNSLKSPTAALKSARTPSFSREGILGSAQKARNLSQSSENRPDTVSNGIQKASSDEGINPLKRRNTDAGVDYPRRRATIAVCVSPPPSYPFALVVWSALQFDAETGTEIPLTFIVYSARFADRENRGVMARNQNASSARNWALSASIESRVSSSMLGTS